MFREFSKREELKKALTPMAAPVLGLDLLIFTLISSKLLRSFAEQFTILRRRVNGLLGEVDRSG